MSIINCIKKSSLVLLILCIILPAAVHASKRQPKKELNKTISDRQYWADLLYKISAPVLSNMSKGELQKNMQVELSPSWDGRNQQVTYMECFGRLMAGLAPWLALPNDQSAESKQREQLRQWALASYKHAVDPQSPDCLLWDKHGQALVDAAFIANSFMRAPKALWEPLDDTTKMRYIERFQRLRRFDPPYTNWLLFCGTIEAFLYSVNAEFDMYRIQMSLRKVEEWYVGDGWYSDGESFAFDYYNSYVIQPMYVEILDLMYAKKKVKQERLDVAVQRMQRYAQITERFVSPEGTFPVFGRSITYRMAVFQPLALLALQSKLPADLPPGQVRAAITAAMKRVFASPANFNEKGFLQLGFTGHQPHVADWYTNNGSMYLTSEVFLPLGLPADHAFWTSEPLDWTSKKAWSEGAFPKDKAIKN